MTEVPYARDKRTTYENFEARCPNCGKWCIFNRVTDLKDPSPISFRQVECLSDSCGKPFNINGDSINSPHEMLILDCYDLLARKHYMGCILSLAQSYEVFFSLYFRVELLYKPFGLDPAMDIAHLNRLAAALTSSLDPHTFDALRNLFLGHLVSSGQTPRTLADAEQVIAALPSKPRTPSDAEIRAVPDAALAELLLAVKATTLNRLRNKVVHKGAYRPTRVDAQTALEETSAVLFPLTSRLDLKRDINWYMRSRAE
jgi:hypothetical protein